MPRPFWNRYKSHQLPSAQGVIYAWYPRAGVDIHEATRLVTHVRIMGTGKEVDIWPFYFVP